MSRTVVKNFLSFMERIRKSQKPVLRQLYQITKEDVRTTTGSNLRNILLLTDLNKVDDLTPNVIKHISYKPISGNDMWRVQLTKEIIDMKSGIIETPDGWTNEELNEALPNP